MPTPTSYLNSTLLTPRLALTSRLPPNNIHSQVL